MLNIFFNTINRLIISATLIFLTRTVDEAETAFSDEPTASLCRMLETKIS